MATSVVLSSAPRVTARAVAQVDGLESAMLLEQEDVEPATSGEPKALTEADAIEIWIARWLRIRRRDLIARYGCDPRRLYEIWWGERFPAAREKAATAFRTRYPGLADRTDYGYRRIPRPSATPDGEQLSLFD